MSIGATIFIRCRRIITSRVQGFAVFFWISKCIKTTDAVGHVLCHDITRIVKDVVKDTAFRKGHIVQEEDIPVLLSLGKDHLYVWEKDENTLHENEAAQILCDVCIKN